MANYLRAAALLLASTILPSCAPVDALNATVSLDGVSVQHDIAYAPGADGGMDVYRPAGAGEKLPLVVFIYGGSWRSGSKNDYRFVAAPLARRGFVVAVPDYRKVPSVRFPAFLQDNAKAVAFARDHAAAWGADPGRVFLIGHSAGAYDVLMLGFDPQYLAAFGVASRDLAGVVALAAPADFLPFDDADVIAAFGHVADPELTQPGHFAANPAPPLLLLHGGVDDIVYPRNSIAMERKVRAAGGDAELLTYPDLGHIGIVTAFAPVFQGRSSVLEDVVAFLRRHSGAGARAPGL